MKIRPVKGSCAGVVEVIGSGIICDRAFDYFRAEMARCLSDAPSYVLRMDTAVMALARVPHVGEYRSYVCSRVAAMVVQRDQYDFWVEYCEKLASVGYPRNVFTACRKSQAYAFAELQAREFV